MVDVSRKFWVASGLALTLVACDQNGGDPSQLEATKTIEGGDERTYFEALFSEPFVSGETVADAPVDFAAAFANLPEELTLETGPVSVVEGSGATRVESFAIVYDLEGEGVGLQADEVLFYGFNPDAITGRLEGTNLSESVKVADRIEMRGVKSVGMDAVSQLFMERYLETLDEFTPIDSDLVYPDEALEFLSYNFEMEGFVIDGFTLEPFSYAKQEPELITAAEDGSEGELDEFEPEAIDLNEVDDEVRSGFQYIAAFARAFSVDAIAYKNLKADYEMSMDGVSLGMEMALPLAGLRGYKRGDLDYSGTWDARFEGSFPVPSDPNNAAEMTSLPMAGGIAFSEHSGLRLARAFEALADWEMPASDETDFMDLGSLKMSDYRLDLDGSSLFKMKSFALETDFHWLLPTKFDLSLTDTGYNFANLFGTMSNELIADMDGSFTAEDLQRGLSIIENYGFDCFCGDFALRLTWDENSGDIAYRERGQFAEAFKGSTNIDFGFSRPAAISAAFDSGDPEEAIEEAFKSDFAFRGLSIEMNDIGGLTNLFEMLHAIGEAFPDQEGMAMLAYNDAAQLRMLAVNSIIGMKPMVRQQFEPADPWMTALANFLEEGGALKVEVIPPKPITAALIEEMEAAGTEPEPEEIVEIFGISVTHTK